MTKISLFRLMAAIFLTANFTGCSQEDSLNPIVPEADGRSVGITLTVGGDLPGSRALPPGEDTLLDGTSQVDKVRIVTFVRKAGSADPFIYDGNNDKTVSCSPENGIRTARSKLTKIAGNEYRVIAIGYYTGRGEDTMFSLNASTGTTFDNFQATLREQTISDYNEIKQGTEKYWNGKWLYTPELFYGYCHAGDQNPVISSNGSSQLTGILYRGMAKVVIKITGIQQGTWSFDWFALMSETTYTQTDLNDYERFKTPHSPVAANPDNAYKNNKWTLLDKQTVSNQTVTLSAYILPATTRLLIRMKSRLTAISPWQRDDYQIYINNVSSAEGATGIISPTAQNNVFYFRRNSQYNLTGTYTALSNSSHKLN